jgi:hypothetical protein
VYILCSATALLCAVLLLRGYWRSGAALLLWCGLFFVAMTLENAILFVDLVVVPHIDLLMVRQSVALAGAGGHACTRTGKRHEVKSRRRVTR